jgi:hypothetical protein
MLFNHVLLLSSIFTMLSPTCPAGDVTHLYTNGRRNKTVSYFIRELEGSL